MNPMIAQAEPEMKQDIDQVGNILQRMLILTGDEEKMLACVRKWGQRDQAQRATSVPGPAGIFDHFLLLTKLRSYSRRAARNAWIEEHASVFDGLFYELKGSRLNEFRRLVSLSRHEAAIGPTTERSENEWKGMGRQVALGLYGINEAVGLGLTQQFDDMAATTTDKLQSVINMFGGHHELARPQALTPYIAQQYAQLTPMVRDALGANKDNDVSVFGMTADQFGQFGGKGVSFLVNMGLGKAMAATKVVQTGNTLLDATQAMNESMGKIADRVLARRKENPSLTPFECLEDKEVLEDLVDIVAAAAQMGTAFAGSGKSTVGLRKKLKMLRLGTRFVQAGFRVDKSAELIARQVVAINARTPNASLADYLEDDQILNELVAAALASAEMGKTASGLAAPKSRIGLWAAKLEKTAQGLGGVGTAAAMLSANSSLHTLVEMALKLHVAHPQGDPADFLHDAGVRSEAGRLLGAAATLAGTGSQGKKLYTKTASMGSQVQLALTFGRAGGQAITGVFSAISKRVGELQEADPFAPVSSYINDEGVSKQIEGLFQVVSAPGFADDALTRGRDRLISGAGKALSGFTLHRQFAHDGELTGPFCPEHMAREPKSAEEEVSGGATLFINGVNTTYEYHRKTAQRLANETGQVVAGIYNATGVTQGKGETLGLWRDVAQTMGDKLFDTGRNPAVSRLVDLVLRYGDAKHPDGKMKIIAHSQGSVIVSEALRQARKKNNDLSHLDVTTFGNAAFTFPKGATYHNYVFDSDVFASTLGTNSRIAHWMNRNPVGAWLSNRLLGPVDDALAHTTVMHQSGGPLRAHQVNNKAEDAPDGGPDYISSLGRFRAKEKAVRKSPGLLPSYMNAEASTGFGLARNLGSGLAGGISSLYGKADKGIRSLPSLPFLPKNTVWGGMDWLARKGGSALTHAGDWLGRHHDNSYGKDFAQRSAVGTRPNVDPVALRDHLHREGGSGVTPSSHLRQQLGGHLGFDPSGARLHTGPAAAQAARSLNAEAFTIGRDVFFGNGHFDPTTPKGLGLIAHELTHVGQQTGTTGNKARFFTGQGGDEMEREAQGMGAHVLANAGHRSGLFVEDYIREYEGEHDLSQSDQQRLDRISVMALEEVQRMLEQQVRGSINGNTLDVQVEIDLKEMSDAEAMRKWAEAIVAQLMAQPASSPGRQSRLQRSAAEEEPTFFGTLWDSVKSGEVEQEIYAYGKGLGKGVYQAGTGLANMAAHPIDTAQGMYHVATHLEEMNHAVRQALCGYWDTAGKDPARFAEMTGEIVGQAEMALVTPSRLASGRDAAGLLKTAGTLSKRVLGMETPLWTYTTAGRMGEIMASSKTASKVLKALPNKLGRGAVFATPIPPELMFSQTFLGLMSRSAIGRLAVTQGMKFMSPAFKAMMKSNVEGLIGRSKSILGHMVADADKVVVEKLALQTIDDPVAMEKMLNAAGYVVTVGGIVVQATQDTKTKNQPQRSATQGSSPDPGPQEQAAQAIETAVAGHHQAVTNAMMPTSASQLMLQRSYLSDAFHSAEHKVTSLVHGLKEAGENASAFGVALKDGAFGSLKGEVESDQHRADLGKRLLDDVNNPLFTPAFLAGTAVGIGKGAVSAVKMAYHSLTEGLHYVMHPGEFEQMIEETVKATYELASSMFTSKGKPIAEAIGHAIGQEYGDKLKGLLDDKPTAFAYHLGEEVGPTLVGVVLAALGVPEMAGAALAERLAPVLEKLFEEYPMLEKLFKFAKRRNVREPHDLSQNGYHPKPGERATTKAQYIREHREKRLEQRVALGKESPQSHLAQPGGLMATEGKTVRKANGRLSDETHPVTRHLLISDESLIKRVTPKGQGGEGKPIATRFKSRDKMEAAVGNSIRMEQANVQAWLKTNPPAGNTHALPDHYPGMGNLGMGYERVSGGNVTKITAPLVGIRTVLISDGQGGYLVHSAFLLR